MTHPSSSYCLFSLRVVRTFLTRALSFGLITTILAVQTPALPRPLPQLLSESRDSFKFWFHASGWAKTLQDVGGQAATPPAQETQADRDARVASIKIFPGDVTMQSGKIEFFDALAYDSNGRQVGGVKFTWAAEELLTTKAVKILPTGEFIPPAVSSYKLTVQGAGKTAQATVIAVANLVQLQPHIEVEVEPPPGWDPNNYRAARDPVNEVGSPPGRPLHHGAGSNNFQFTAPILSLPGRGIDLSLGAVYNSREWTLWTRQGAQSYSDITYDIDRDWPAPGWSLGFGRVAGLGLSGAMIIDADGTRHSFTGLVTRPNYPEIHFEGHTTDGTFIDYSSDTDTAGTIRFAQANYPNGTVVKYSNPSRGAVYPRRITDANGNWISVQYKDVNGAARGPKILFITDTLERTITFYYEAGKLTAITEPGIDGAERQVVRFHYRTLTLNYAFSSTLTTHVDNATPDVLDAIYYPGSGTGYWFGDADSYSSYGMLAKYSEQRGMGFTAASLDTQGTVTAGTVTRQYAYDYAMTPDNTLTDAPAYTKMTETWAGMDTGDAITRYHSEKTGTTRNATITFPDLSKSVQLSYNTSDQFNGYIYEDDTYDSNNNLLRRSTVQWALGDYDSPRPTRIEAFDELSQKTAAEFDYAPSPSHNQVVTVRDYDYGGTNLLRTTRMEYRNGTEYINRNIFNLVKRVDVWDASDTIRVSRIEYNHDEPADSMLVSTPNVVHHEAAYDPNDSVYYNPATHYRGNVTSIVKYVDANSLTGAITETRTYDITGNMVTTSSSCCEQMSFTYELATQYTYPRFRTRGSADPNSPDRVTTEAIYNFNTGLTTDVTDANQRTTHTDYFSDTLRPQRITLPTTAYNTYAYNDTGMSITETAYKDGSTIASQNVKLLNGLGQVKTENTLGQNSVLDYVDTKYDSMGRVWKQTRPYRTGQTQQWSETLYDALGRAYQVTAPDGSQSHAYFNETTRPSSASTSPGQTTRVVDAWGRERWARLDADGRLAEVVEPNPSGNGSVTATGNVATSYAYDALGNLTQVNQGAQQRSFKYDSLKRLVAQKLAEESARLNDTGTYVGTSTGTWSEVFTYDERSNLITQTDARGVKTVYSYNSDPLNRLQSVSYDTSGFGDTTHPILSSPGVTYAYMTTGDKNRLFKVTTSAVNTDQYDYDTEGRIGTRTLTMTSRSGYPMVTDYTYDALDRVTDVRYPAQYGVAGNPRKVAHQDYEVSSRLTGLTVDSASYASNIVYNAASQTTSLKIGASGANQVTESYTYGDTTGLLTNQKVQRAGVSLLDLSYDYLRAGTTNGRTGQLTKIINNLNRNRDRSYEYDALGRLTKATGGRSTYFTETYAYDRYGNRTSAVASGHTASAKPVIQSLPTDQLIAFDPDVLKPKSLREDPLRIVSDSLFSLSLTSSASTPPASSKSPALQSPAYQGFHDGAGCNTIQGWAWDANNPNSTVNVDIYDGNTFLATVQANMYREDLLNALGNPNHGFSYYTPASLKNGAVHTINVKFSGTNTLLSNTGKTIQCSLPPNFYGRHDGQGCNAIEGWAWDGNDPNGTVNVDIYQDGLLIGTTAATLYRQDLADAGFGAYHGWIFHPPASFKDGQPHTITAKFGGTNTNLPLDTPRTSSCTSGAPNYQGSLDQADCSFISGYAWDTTDDNTIIVAIYVDGNFLVVVPAQQAYPGVGNGYHGFKFATPSWLKDGQLHAIGVKFSGTTTDLYTTPQTIACAAGPAPASYGGIHDVADCSSISGWVWDSSQPNSPINVDIFDGTSFIARVPANQFRQDLLNNGIGNGYHAFSLPTPVSLKDGQTHSVQVRYAGTTSGLSYSPRSLSCTQPPVPLDGLASVSYDQSTNHINSAGWEYDAAGNQTRVQRADGTWQRYVYDAAGRLAKVQNDSGVTQIIHTYGASNHRLIEQVGSESSNNRTYFAWAGDSVIAEYSESDANPSAPSWTKSYVYLGGRLLATIAPSGGSERVEYQHPDRLGTRLVTNNQDTSFIEQVTLPFGTALDAESTGTTKRRFTSYDRSTVSGLDYAVNRHYDPLQGRFTQVDPIGMRSTSLSNPQTLNLYAYCANDPINHLDPSGLGFWSWLGNLFKKIVHAIFKAIIVAVVTFFTSGFNIHAAIAAGVAAFLNDFRVNTGWQPSGGWGRTPPTFGSGPTLRQILGQTDIGRQLTPDRRYFLTPGIIGNAFVKWVYDPGFLLPECTKKLLGLFFPDLNLDEIRGFHGIPWYVNGNPDAYTDQNYIYFNTGQYNPLTINGIALIAHELEHTRQYKYYGVWGFRKRYVEAYVYNRYQRGMSDREAYENSPYEVTARETADLVKRVLLKQLGMRSADSQLGGLQCK